MNKYKVDDIARYIINYSVDVGYPTSNLKLQKLLYYIQAAFLVETGEPCFAEPLTKWRHGPVQVVVYDKYRRYLGTTIDRQDKYTEYKYGLNFSVDRIYHEFDYSNYEDRDREIMDKVIEGNKDNDGWDLTYLTNEEDPLILTEKDKEIDIGLIKDYFANDPINQGRIYGK